MPTTLTQRSVVQAKPHPTKRREIADGALPGFYLVVQPSGLKSWAVRYRVDGRPRKFTLGPFPRLSLADARETARKALQTASQGLDPAAQRAASRRATAGETAFGKVAAEYVQRYSKAHNRTWEEAERLLTRADLAAWKDRDIRLICRRDVLDVLDRVVERGSPVLANRLLARLKHFFKWTVERGILDASPVLGLRPPSPESSRDRILTNDELRAVWKAADDIGYPFGAAIQLLILTGQRRSEVLEAEWPEIDLQGRHWTVPRERSKTNRAHFVPLSDGAADLLSTLPRVGTQLVFTTNGTSPFSGVSKTFACLNRRAAEHFGGPLPQWRPHDLRRTFASGCARLGIPVHVIERALNHTSGTFGGIVGVYQRHDYAEERRRAMDIWASHVTSLLREPPLAVVSLRKVGA